MESPIIRRQASQFTVPDEDLVDPREIDKALSELAGMTGRWGLFRKFLTEQMSVSDSFDSPFSPAYFLNG